MMYTCQSCGGACDHHFAHTLQATVRDGNIRTTKNAVICERCFENETTYDVDKDVLYIELRGLRYETE